MFLPAVMQTMVNPLVEAELGLGSFNGGEIGVGARSMVVPNSVFLLFVLFSGL